jgi:glycyl-tRNA synthetase beta chain
MSMSIQPESLLIEIGCEEIPSRMIADAAVELERRVLSILDLADLAHGDHAAWGGVRRLAVRVEDVQSRQEDRQETVLGPPAKIAFLENGEPSKAAIGFARKNGIDPSELTPLETDRGRYAGFTREVAGSGVGDVLARAFPQAVAEMSFPKTMRWANGRSRWVRPVHWLLALHGESVLPIELFGAEATGSSRGHRFFSTGPVEIGHPDRYGSALEGARVLVDPLARRQRIERLLADAARAAGGIIIDDHDLLEDVADLVEWPGIVTGRFDPGYLDLPRELLITTLRHHQKCFSVQDEQGSLLPVFLAGANTDSDPSGHIRRGNEWVVGGRLEDARFFWREDRKAPLDSLSPKLSGVVFHRKAGTYADKAARIAELGAQLASTLDLPESTVEHCRTAARLAKNDLVTGTVGEFPELQGQVGGLMLRAEGVDDGAARGVYEHYRPMGPDDGLPESVVGQVVAVADKLDSIAELIRVGEHPSGSKDPLGLRRAGNGIVRILLKNGWSTGLADLAAIARADEATLDFLRERMVAVLRDAGFTVKEVLAVTRPRVDPSEANAWPLADVRARLDAIKRIRGREDFRHLVKLTERVDNILTKNADTIDQIIARASDEGEPDGVQTAEAELSKMVDQYAPVMGTNAEQKCYDEIVHILSEFIDPVEQFFTDCLVIDPSQPETTRRRYELLLELNHLFTKYFDIRELAGEAEGRVP